jgi:hypothetical protein
MVPQRGLFGAARLTPSGSPCGRSNWLRQFVEPAFCPSGVRIESVGHSDPNTVAAIFENWCRKEDYSALRASPLRGRPAGDQIGCANLSNRLFVRQGFE